MMPGLVISLSPCLGEVQRHAAASHLDVQSFGTTRRALLPWTWIRTRSFGVPLTARAGRHHSGTRRGWQVGSQRREFGVSPGGQRAFQAASHGERAVPDPRLRNDAVSAAKYAALRG